ncbi:polysaccharide pyruvyl transferase family protein [Texcoconibacillus texcoconensis]|uniref:Colanic acid/amylovoran biosynthesis protein n=1 Tax=Texcoconibacillus texcoconensis TaxID=1095777 RepID=A0A840QSQ8_9BACI|nr:polysaccharide pyruvyl transferase family protein [Texcoconibacillus texcoconensis]MBB5174556.1 colanic acid/amylovoran biosynthesis protein [Texcoconibacillus texcoconensis]
MSYIVIVGGQLQNKGAQAMTFTVVDQVKKAYPNKEVVLFSSVFNQRDRKEREALNFKVIHWPMRMKMKLLGFQTLKHVGVVNYLKYLVRGTGKTKNEETEILNILENTDQMIDISGYALSSQRGYLASLNYIYNLMVANKYKIPVILFPQSFGPFNYHGSEKKVLMPLMEKYLSYPEKIYVRENDGLEHLKPFNLSNVQQTFDSVLQGPKEFNNENIYKKEALGNIEWGIDVKTPAIAIIPNVKIMKHGNEDQIHRYYKALIDRVLKSEKNVYLLRHSFEDLEINKVIKENYKDEQRVILLEDDLNCIQIDKLLSKFDFIIASRYHAIIHAYKNGVPAFVFGWAVKYQELLKNFSQERYMFDVREDGNKEVILDTMDYMLDHSTEESENINQKMLELDRVELFNV